MIIRGWADRASSQWLSALTTACLSVRLFSGYSGSYRRNFTYRQNPADRSIPAAARTDHVSPISGELPQGFRKET
jgi:hypothetical protein